MVTRSAVRRLIAVMTLMLASLSGIGAISTAMAAPVTGSAHAAPFRGPATVTNCATCAK
jgi:hypothetical protein